MNRRDLFKGAAATLVVSAIPASISAAPNKSFIEEFEEAGYKLVMIRTRTDGRWTYLFGDDIFNQDNHHYWMVFTENNEPVKIVPMDILKGSFDNFTDEYEYASRIIDGLVDNETITHVFHHGKYGRSETGYLVGPTGAIPMDRYHEYFAT